MRLSAQIKTELTNRLRDNADKLISGLNKKHSKNIQKAFKNLSKSNKNHLEK